MARYVAFLRGMNVGGHRVTSAELRELFAGMGFDGAATFRTSGNVIFDAGDEEARDDIRARVGQALEAAPDSQARDAVLAHATEDDRLDVRGRELYWLPSGGTLDSQLDLKAMAGLVGLTTMRTKGTIELIAAKHCAD